MFRSSFPFSFVVLETVSVLVVACEPGGNGFLAQWLEHVIAELALSQGLVFESRGGLVFWEFCLFSFDLPYPIPFCLPF